MSSSAAAAAAAAAMVLAATSAAAPMPSEQVTATSHPSRSQSQASWAASESGPVRQECTPDCRVVEEPPAPWGSETRLAAAAAHQEVGAPEAATCEAVGPHGPVDHLPRPGAAEESRSEFSAPAQAAVRAPFPLLALQQRQPWHPARQRARTVRSAAQEAQHRARHLQVRGQQGHSAPVPTPQRERALQVPAHPASRPRRSRWAPLRRLPVGAAPGETFSPRAHPVE